MLKISLNPQINLPLSYHLCRRLQSWFLVFGFTYQNFVSIADGFHACQHGPNMSVPLVYYSKSSMYGCVRVKNRAFGQCLVKSFSLYRHVLIQFVERDELRRSQYDYWLCSLQRDRLHACSRRADDRLTSTFSRMRELKLRDSRHSH